MVDLNQDRCQTLPKEENRLTELETVERARTRRAWQDAPIEDLLDLLEAETLPSGFSADDAPFILDTLYYARSATLSPAHIERLNAIAENQSFRPLGSRNADRLACDLTVIEDNPSRFFQYWDSLHPDRQRTGPARSFLTRWLAGMRRDLPTRDPNRPYLHLAITTAAGDLQIDREDVVNSLVAEVAREGVMRFRFRFDSMLALGKIGQRAGEAAAATIEQHIYESSDLVASIRRVAIARIRSSSDEWRRCDNCVRGRVLDTAHGVPGFAMCSRCFGLAHVLRGRSPLE